MISLVLLHPIQGEEFSFPLLVGGIEGERKMAFA
jgi:hypothetical protein